MKTVRIFFGGTAREIIDANGKTWKFSTHESGIVRIHEAGGDSEQDCQAFMAAARLWAAQGCVVSDTGFCQWREEVAGEAPTGEKEADHGQSHC
ncbi:hypothetical protein HNP48_002299 [Acidovorax soli]|uniref:Uncharacterized protein n=1 Tax=Acidovorax soli TaxID=592050 RepID=A0A7X0PCY4_9BURK|nr:hypothetical protein [Acidovorax soli]MBB6559632.1 hypothetical protein [Acidovorax soli]